MKRKVFEMSMKPPPKNSSYCFLFEIGNFIVVSFVAVFNSPSSISPCALQFLSAVLIPNGFVFAT